MKAHDKTCEYNSWDGPSCHCDCELRSLQAELREAHEAIGLLTTQTPSVQMRPNDLLGMAQEMVEALIKRASAAEAKNAELTQELAQLRAVLEAAEAYATSEQNDEGEASAASYEATRDASIALCEAVRKFKGKS